MNYDKVLVKIEDKKECNRLKNLLKDRYKVALYTGDSKEVKLNDDGLFDENVDVVISTSSIQNGQSIKENILSIFVQTYIDTISSVKQFLGRNRNRNSDVYVYARYGKHLNKRKYSTPNNRYERYLNRLRDNAWNSMSKEDWYYTLYNFGRVRFDDDDEPVGEESIDEESIDEESVDEHIVDEPVNESVVDSRSEVLEENEPTTNEIVVDELNTDIEFTTKRALYDYYGIDVNTIPDGYEVKMRYTRVNGVRGRLYRLMKL